MFLRSLALCLAFAAVFAGHADAAARVASARAATARVTKAMEIYRHEGSSHGYLAVDPKTKKAILVDAPSGAAKRFLPQIKKDRLEVAAIFLTHDHGDHVVDLHPLWEATRASIVYSEAMPGMSQFVKVDDGAVLEAGSLRFHTMRLPGHSEDSAAFYEPHHGALFVGDTLQASAAGGNLRDPRFLRSLHRLIQLPPETKVLAGHGAFTTIGAESGWIRSVLETEAPHLLK